MLRTQRKRLEAAYRRIRDKLDSGEYGSSEEVAKDVENALEPADADVAGLEGHADEPEPPPSGNDGEGLDATTKERIYRTFRRVVLPQVHSDTSDVDVSEFEIAFAAFQSKDYTLMEAFVIRYSGEIGLDEDGESLTQGQLKNRLREYQAAQKRLDDRLRVIRREITSAEVTAPDAARKRMEAQGEKFRRAIVEETDKIHELRRRLGSLADTARRDGDERHG